MNEILKSQSRAKLAMGLVVSITICFSAAAIGGMATAGLSKLSSSKSLQFLTLYGNTVTDAHLQTLPSFPNLQFLQICAAPVTDSGIKSLGTIKRLRQLDIFEAIAVTDAGIQQLENLTNLEQLKLLQTALTNDSLPAISKMVALKQLQLDGHQVTPSKRSPQFTPRPRTLT